MLSSLVVCASAPPRLHTLTSTPSHLLRAPPSSKLGPPPRYVTQPRDHFDASDTKTWQQAYYVNDTFWTGPNSNAPVFLCVGGEGPPLDGSVVGLIEFSDGGNVGEKVGSAVVGSSVVGSRDGCGDGT